MNYKIKLIDKYKEKHIPKIYYKTEKTDNNKPTHRLSGTVQRLPIHMKIWNVNKTASYDNSFSGANIDNQKSPDYFLMPNSYFGNIYQFELTVNSWVRVWNNCFCFYNILIQRIFFHSILMCLNIHYNILIFIEHCLCIVSIFPSFELYYTILIKKYLYDKKIY